MKVYFILIVFLLSGSQLCFPQNISKEDIIKTVAHMKLLTEENKLALIHAQADFQIQGAALQSKTLEAAKWHAEAHEDAKERDVLVYLFSFISGWWLLSRYQDFQIPINPPWKWVIEWAFFATGFGAAYAAGRYLLTWCAHFIP